MSVYGIGRGSMVSLRQSMRWIGTRIETFSEVRHVSDDGTNPLKKT